MLLKFLLSYPGLLAAEEVLRTEVFLKESFPNRDLESKQNRFKTISGVNFIKVGRKAQIIERVLSICALRLRPTF